MLLSTSAVIFNPVIYEGRQLAPVSGKVRTVALGRKVAKLFMSLAAHCGGRKLVFAYRRDCDS